MGSSRSYLFNPERNPLKRSDYRPAEYKITHAKLHIGLDETETTVKSRISVEANPAAGAAAGQGPLILDGENVKLKSVKIVENGVARELDRQEYVVTDKHLTIKRPPKGRFEMEIETEINPSTNTRLSGIYTAGDIICSQCEAQGFRRITYFLDRPDNLAVFDVTLEADKKKYPVLLSNGNGDHKQSVDLGNGRHQVKWSDPWPKPSYLFAVIGGNLKMLEDSFTTMSGRKVALKILVQPGYEDKISWAMESIKRAMKWDEEKYGREYDLDVFHIAAVDKFNAGAMENKGLNIFNVSLLIGDHEISTDSQLINIEAVIGHEYFHNYTGDRVTLRDWFELTLKEGLTVLRDRQFTSDLHSSAIQTIDDAIELRAGQFNEDMGFSAHPIRPDLVEEFDNIYSSTIYTKGSHILGMMQTLMGEKTWRLAMDAYFDKYDGQAVTCDDFINNMQEISGLDLSQFRLWYSQSGTPEISYDGKYDPEAKTYTLTLKQKTPPTADQPSNTKPPLHMPISIGLIGQSGKDVPLTLEGESGAGATTRILELKQESQTFVFKNVSGPVVPSILRGFSAPVKITTQPTDDELVFRMAHDSDPFNRYEAGERLMLKVMHQLLEDQQAGKPLALPQNFIDAYRVNVANALSGDTAFAARMLTLPASSLLAQDLKTLDPDATKTVRDFMMGTLAKTFQGDFKNIYALTRAPANETYNVSPAQVGRREMHNLSLSFLSKLATPNAIAAAEVQYQQATNMTERYSALANLAQFENETSKKYLADFYQQFKSVNNVVDKWLMLSASGEKGDAIGRIRALMQHEAFDITNPNKVRAVMAGIAPTVLHNKDGSGYKMVADVVIQLNIINPRTACRLIHPLMQLKRYDQDRQTAMVKQLERIMKTANLDAGIKELVGQALATVQKTSKKPSASANFDKAAG